MLTEWVYMSRPLSVGPQLASQDIEHAYMLNSHTAFHTNLHVDKAAPDSWRVRRMPAG